ncbi:type II toxin-antitoxin system VapC family toxin [Nocardiopsis sp. NPDC049922]|uniref:type II toxin-antitoxin system VapC family toxin n=1 Tax=Nocardiopsis sp. NPDC049922 TaxID=3155157 RepID=UPI0034041F02
MIIVDASVLVNALTSTEDAGRAARERLGPEELAAPSLVDWEVASVLLSLSKGTRGGKPKLAPGDRDRAMESYRRLTIVRNGLHHLWPRMRELSANLSGYDAAYVALAEDLGVPLITADERVKRGAQTSADIEVI